jgi:hypothetical protein
VLAAGDLDTSAPSSRDYSISATLTGAASRRALAQSNGTDRPSCRVIGRFAPNGSDVVTHDERSKRAIAKIVANIRSITVHEYVWSP